MQTAIEHPISEALGPHLVFAGSDLDETHAAISRTLCPSALRLLHRGDRLAVRQHAARVGNVTLAAVGFGADIDIVAGDVERFFGVQVPLAGRAEVCSGSESVIVSPDVASVAGPDEPLRMRWEAGAVKLVVKVDQDVVERHLASLLGRTQTDPLRPALEMRVDGPAGVRWNAVLQLLLAEVATADATPRPRISTVAVEEVVLNWLALSQPNNYWERLRAADSPVGPVHVRRAIEYATARLDQPLTVTTLAEATGVSARTLQSGFRRALGCSPAAYVRGLRLDQARADLQGAEPGDGTRVTDVALRWGFSHFGRFAALYRRRFGERPSATLRG